MEGQLDRCDHRTVSGWAWNPANPDAVSLVEIVDGDEVVATVEASGYRADLEVAEKRGGRCAFLWQMPASRLDDEEHTLHVRFAGGPELATSPRVVLLDATEHRRLQQNLQATMRALPWEVEQVSLENGKLRIEGWAIPPIDGRTPSFALNGKAFDHASFGHPSPRLESLYWYWPGAEGLGFEAEIAVTDLFAEGPATLDFIDADTGAPFDPGQRLHWPTNLFGEAAIPPAASIQRTSGHSERLLFLQHGYTSYVRLEALLRDLVGAWPAGRTLDWGSGCGRVTRWLINADLPGVTVFGADIDDENVRWSREHVPGAQFDTIPLHPPTAYPDGHFQVIYGLSVLTHLTEGVQFEWLHELMRILAPGGHALLTFHGAASVCLAMPDQAWLDRLDEAGFDASIRDDFLSEYIDESEYYRATFHTLDYVRERWSDVFEIVDIHEGFICHQQDMAVLRRRAD